MKNIFILFLSTALLGCAKKYGCTTLIKNSNYPPKSITLTKNPNYIPPKNYICRGNGHVEKIDSNKMLIRVNGVVIKNDTGICTTTKYIVAYGSFSKTLREYQNKNIKFECNAIFPKNDEILFIVNGCVEGMESENFIINNKK